MVMNRAELCGAIVAASSLAFAGSAYAADYGKEKAQILDIERHMAAAQTAAEVTKYFAPDIVFEDFFPDARSLLKMNFIFKIGDAILSLHAAEADR